jgi:ankyrin repeat protein
MAPSYFPLRWESTGDQWWYATPIDLAAANGLYDLVTELLHFDTNNLIKLTSLRRIRRLETVWDDDDESKFEDVAKCRSYVARKLLIECEETETGKNSLINGGYGGWLLYTAASAGDLEFVHELLRRDSLLVFGEGEYGVTDMLYAAARSKNSEVFNMILDFALLGRECSIVELDESGDGGGVFMREILNRAIHAAARGGNWEILKKQLILGSASQILLSYRDAQGCTVLHSAAGRGQVEVRHNHMTCLVCLYN